MGAESSLSGSGLHRVELLGIDLDAWAQWSDHHNSVMREAALIAGSDATERARVPGRLVGLIDRLNDDYGAPMAGLDTRRREAEGTGQTTLDLTLHVPISVGDSCRELTDLLDEVDGFCAAGDMLTIAPPGEVIEFRRWYLLQFVHQLAGQPPVPWPEWRARRADDHAASATP